mmetsp:Transcript_99949/g.271724  ORF Transcript_99949/g.271724 Transcript_99949/m.271724 type:complete len:124 (-) Transcript_99949:36-407(-)
MRRRCLMEIADNVPSRVHGVVQVRLRRLVETTVHHRLVRIHQRVLRLLRSSLRGALCSIRCGLFCCFASCVQGLSSGILSQASNCADSMLYMRRCCFDCIFYMRRCCFLQCTSCVYSSICSTV